MARKLIVEIIGDSSSLEKSFKKTSLGAKNLERDLGHVTRGVAAGSSLFKGLGRSLAFASGGFIAAAGITDIIKSSIQAATEAATVQKQLAAQFRASGQDLSGYQQQIDKTSESLSELAGFQNDQLKQSFTTAFRASNSVAVAFKIQATAADAARGTGKDLQTITLGLTKAYLGQTAAAKRLGIVIPANVKGMAALEFVSRKFAGQARAGTTDQERFAAALHNTEEIIGTQLLPGFNKLLVSVTKFLNNPKNQKKIQDDTKKTVSVVGKSVSFLGKLGGAFADLVRPINDAAAASRRFNAQLEKALRLGANQGDFAKGVNVTGGGGDFTTQTVRPQRESGAPLPTPPPAQRTGLHAQLLRSQLALAKAQTTATKADDRRVLEQQRKIVEAAIKLTTNLKKLTTLYKQLADIQNQIAGIDQDAQNAKDTATQKAKDAAETHARKVKEARDKALAAAKNRAEKEKAQDAKELSLLKAREDRLKNQIKAIQGRFQAQLDAARQGIGDLFAGPVKADVNEAARRTLGLQTTATGIGALTSNLRAQTNQAAAFQRDINTLIKRGAPNELIKELRAAGVAGAGTQAHTLATATGSALKAFLTEFGKREKLALTTTQTIMRSQTVTLTADKIKLENLKTDIHNHVTVELDGQKISATVTKNQVRAQRRTAAQKTGRIAGLGPVVG